jgi:hypothetical protein
MSAATEHLIEQIREVEASIKVAEQAGQDVTEHRANLTFLQRRLASLNETLTEGKQILKG